MTKPNDTTLTVVKDTVEALCREGLAEVKDGVVTATKAGLKASIALVREEFDRLVSGELTGVPFALEKPYEEEFRDFYRRLLTEHPELTAIGILVDSYGQYHSKNK